MTHFDEITEPTECNLLVSFFDLSSFARYAHNHTNRDIFDLLSEYFEFVGAVVEKSNGHVVKFVGDAGLVVFSEEDVDRGIMALKVLQDTGDKWMAGRSVPCRNVIQAHFGAVVCGPVGTRDDKRFDVFGDTVNTAATLNSRSFAMTPQVFRKLKPETRKHFKKHTAPILYIPIAEKHPE